MNRFFCKFKALAASAALLAMLVSMMAGCAEETPAPSSQASQPVDQTEAQTEPTESGEMSVTDLLKTALTLKSDMETALDGILEGETEDAQKILDAIPQTCADVRTSLDKTLENMGESLPSLQEQLMNLKELLSLIETASDTILRPLAVQIAENPLSDLSTGDGIAIAPLCEYIDFAESLMDDISALIEQANSVDLSLIDGDGELSEYLEEANELLSLYRADPTVFAKAKAMLGADGDRLYLIAAQNSAEIRASGGFPGAMGTVQIKDGVLYMGEFERVYDILSSYTPAGGNVTAVENNLFYGGLTAPRDADFCPDFERVAYIWSLGYESRQGSAIDGVISVTPCVLQRLLAAIDAEVELFDGTRINGENAVQILQHDLYFQYFAGSYVYNATTITDDLFADAAKKSFEVLTQNLSFSDLKEYLSVAKDSVEDRTLMLWMADEEEQTILQTLGCHGGLNTDPEQPQAGVYFSCTAASKMGMFLVMDTEMGERVKNEDGSYTYPITVTLKNSITQEELQSAYSYITGGSSAICSALYVFAPAGGTIGDVTVSNGLSVSMETYHDLQLGYIRNLNIYPDKPVTVTYYVTTAPGVETELTFSKTPTIQDYLE